MPVEPVVMVESTIFGRDERLAHEAWNACQRYVDPPNVLEAPKEAPRAVHHATAFRRLVGADLRAGRTAVESTRVQPRVARHDRERDDVGQNEEAPVASHPLRLARTTVA